MMFFETSMWMSECLKLHQVKRLYASHHVPSGRVAFAQVCFVKHLRCSHVFLDINNDMGYVFLYHMVCTIQ